MKTVVVTRNGQIKLRVSVEVRNGILRNGDNILINGDLITPPHTAESVAAAIRAKKITPEIEAMGMRIGDNGNGLICRWADDIEAEFQAKRQAEYNALPAEVRACQEERIAISLLYDAAYRSLNHDTDDDNVSRGYRQLAKADARLKAWREEYPAAAKEEDRQALLAKAAKQEDMAAGAMTYDSDGWLSQADQERRRDEYLAKAAEYRKQAAELAD